MYSIQLKLLQRSWWIFTVSWHLIKILLQTVTILRTSVFNKATTTQICPNFTGAQKALQDIKPNFLLSCNLRMRLYFLNSRTQTTCSQMDFQYLLNKA